MTRSRVYLWLGRTFAVGQCVTHRHGLSAHAEMGQCKVTVTVNHTLSLGRNKNHLVQPFATRDLQRAFV